MEIKEIILISGKAQAGKDTTAKIIKEYFENSEKEKLRVAIVPVAGYLKYLATELYGWNGEKDEEGRSLLQNLGEEIRKNSSGTFWTENLVSLFKNTLYLFDVFIVPDIRYKNEIEMFDYLDCPGIRLNLTTVRIDRVRQTKKGNIKPFKNHLTEDQKRHKSETELDNYLVNCTIWNVDGNISVLEEKAKDLARRIEHDRRN